MKIIIFSLLILITQTCYSGENRGNATIDEAISGLWCHNVIPHHLIKVKGPGHYANPDGVGGFPKKKNCKGYVVDFISDKKMSIFKPDRDWLKAKKFKGINPFQCEKCCKDNKYYSLFLATVQIYQCSSKKLCDSRLFSKVGQFKSFYKKLTQLKTGKKQCALVVTDGVVPVVKGAYGVRIVILHTLQTELHGMGYDYGAVPIDLGFNASGIVGNPSVKREKFKPLKN